MFDSYADGGRRRRIVGRTLLAIVAAGCAGYGVYAIAPRLYGVTPPRPRVVVRSQPATVAMQTVRRDQARFAQGGFGGFGGQEVALVERFDKDGDGRLNTAERQAAREAVSQMPRQGRGFGGGFSFGPTDSGPRLTPAQVRSYPNAALYEPSALRTIFLQFENADWEDELTAFYHTDVDVPATMIVDGNTYRDVGVHFRGNSSFRGVPAGRKHSMQVTVDFTHNDQNLYGYRTLNLLNASQDPTFLRPVLYNEIARDYIPAARANFMRVVINGESWGVYPNTQVFNKDYVRDNFKTTKGARWKVPGSPRGRAGLEYFGDDIDQYKRLFEIKTKDDPRDWAALVNLARVLNETPPDRLEAALAPILDVDGMLRFLAIDNALINNDGYWTRASDFNIYLDETGRFHMLPHDFNETMGVIEARGFNGGAGARPGTYDLDPLIGLDDSSKPLRSRLLVVPALRERYLGYVRDIAERWLDWKKLGVIVANYRSLIAPDVRTDTHRLYGLSEFDPVSGGSSLKAFADARRAYLLRYLAAR
jgi:hypothetical protein